MNRCTNCGQTYPDEFKICPQCGISLIKIDQGTKEGVTQQKIEDSMVCMIWDEHIDKRVAAYEYLCTQTDDQSVQSFIQDNETEFKMAVYDYAIEDLAGNPTEERLVELKGFLETIHPFKNTEQLIAQCQQKLERINSIKEKKEKVRAMLSGKRTQKGHLNMDDNNVQNNLLSGTTEITQRSVNGTTAKNKKKLIISLVPLMVGAIIVIMGLVVLNKAVDSTTIPVIHSYSYSPAYISNYSFGGDFYTEIYNADYTIANEINSIGSIVSAGLTDTSSSIHMATKSIIETLYYVSGMLMIAIGLAISAISCLAIPKYIE